jgi:magnesium transporter
VCDPYTGIVITPIYQVKRVIVELSRSVTPLAAPLQTLTQPGSSLPKEVRRCMRGVADRHVVVTERIYDFDESLSEQLKAAWAKCHCANPTTCAKYR